MNDLRKAAEQALNHLTNLQPYLGNGLLNKTQLAFVEPNIDEAMKELRQALEQNDLEEAISKGTKAWADVPDATEWVEQLRGNVDKVNISEERVHKTEKSIHEPEWVGLSDDEREHFRKLGFVGVLAVEAKLKEKNV